MFELPFVVLKPDQRLDTTIREFRRDLIRCTIGNRFRPKPVHYKGLCQSGVAADPDFAGFMVNRRIDRKPDGRGEIFRIAFGRAALFPVDDQFQLFFRESFVVAEIAEAFYSAPGRHAALQHFLSDIFRPRARRIVRHEIPRRIASVMARPAVRNDEPDHFPIERDFRGDGVVTITRASDAYDRDKAAAQYAHVRQLYHATPSLIHFCPARMRCASAW